MVGKYEVVGAVGGASRTGEVGGMGAVGIMGVVGAMGGASRTGDGGRGGSLGREKNRKVVASCF